MVISMPQNVLSAPLNAIYREVNFASTPIAASGTLTLVSDLFAGRADGIRIKEVHLKAKTVLNGSNGSNLDIRRIYGDVTTASPVTIFTAAGCIACDAAADARQVFSTTTATKLIDGVHPEDGSLSVATLDDAMVFRFPGGSERFRLQLQNPGAAAITSGILQVIIVTDFASLTS
jgi:hypothetical protein